MESHDKGMRLKVDNVGHGGMKDTKCGTVPQNLINSILAGLEGNLRPVDSITKYAYKSLNREQDHMIRGERPPHGHT